MEESNLKKEASGISISEVECQHGKVFTIKNIIDDKVAQYLVSLIPAGLPRKRNSEKFEQKIRENLPRQMRSDVVPGEFIIINPDHLGASFREEILKLVESKMKKTRADLKIFRAQINMFKSEEKVSTRTLIPHADLIDPNIESVAININITKGTTICTGLWRYNHGDQNSKEYGSCKEINEITDLYIKKANDLEEIKNNGENIEAKNLCLKYWKKYYELRAGYLDASMYDGKIFHSPLLDKCKEDTRVTMAIFMAFQKPFN